MAFELLNEESESQYGIHSFRRNGMPKLNLNQMDETEEEVWKKSIGQVIWCMGQLEFLSYEWCLCLGGVLLRDSAIQKPGFSARHSILANAISESSWPDDKKKDALILWRRAKAFSCFRNIVAHSPVITNRQTGQAGIVDSRKLRGIGKRPVCALTHQKLQEVSENIQKLAQVLDWNFRELVRTA
jgi:hypothetical protein